MLLGQTKSYLFDEEGNFLFDPSHVEFADGVARLKMDLAENDYSEDYATSDGFSFDSSLAEFSGGLLRQKDQRAANSLVGATYTSSKNLNWALTGTLAATDVGTPVLSGGKLVCLGGGNNGVRYDGAPEVGTSAGNIGALRFKYTPNYSGTPPTNYNLVEFSPSSGNASRMLVFHSSTGTLRLSAYTSAGTVKHAAVPFGAVWSPVAGTEYELELNWDTIAGVVRLFVNGVLNGSMAVSSYDRGTSATRMHVGAGSVYTAADGSYNDVEVFSVVQHTAGYTPGYSVPEYVYLESAAALPEFAHATAGSFIEVSDFASTDSGSPRYTVQVGQSGDYLYWNGSAWVESDGTYAQANPAATFEANISSIPVEGEHFAQIKVHFQSSNSQQSVSDTSLQILSSIGFTSEAKSITALNRFQAGKLTQFSESVDEPTGTEVRYILEIESVKRYWDGESFVRSDGSFEQSNSKEELDEGILSAVDRESYVRLIALLKTTEDTVTPEIASATFMYDVDPNGGRGFYDTILAFIGAPTLTDEEFESIEVEDPDLDLETYTAMLTILDDRETVSDTRDRLTSYFEAGGVEVTEPSAGKTNILVGGSL